MRGEVEEADGRRVGEKRMKVGYALCNINHLLFGSRYT